MLDCRRLSIIILTLCFSRGGRLQLQHGNSLSFSSKKLELAQVKHFAFDLDSWDCVSGIKAFPVCVRRQTVPRPYRLQTVHQQYALLRSSRSWRPDSPTTCLMFRNSFWTSEMSPGTEIVMADTLFRLPSTGPGELGKKSTLLRCPLGP